MGSRNWNRVLELMYSGGHRRREKAPALREEGGYLGKAEDLFFPLVDGTKVCRKMSGRGCILWV